MDSNSGKKHRRTRHRVRSSSGSKGRSESQRRRSPVQASSSFAALSGAPSKVPLSVPEPKDDPAIFKSYLFGLLGVCVLILLGGGHHVYALGTALILPGLALLLLPPTRSLGKWLDVGVFGLLGSLLFAFVPVFYWKVPVWRTTAVDDIGLDLPWSLSVQPWISFEAYLLVIAGFSWLYAASAWKLNYSGRKWLYFWLSCMMLAFALVVLVGNLYGLRYPGAEDATAFSFFPNNNQTVGFIAIGGVLLFGYAMEGLRRRRLVQLVGLLASILCLIVLVHGGFRVGLLLYCTGICLWFLFSLHRSKLSLFLRVVIPLALLSCSFLMMRHEPAVTGVVESRMLMYRDVVDMIEEAPLTGHGLGNFEAVFPQYRNWSQNSQNAVHPESDLFWLGAEGGLISVGFMGLLLVAYLGKCRTSGLGRSGAFRMIALTGVVLFVVHGLFDVVGHQPGTAYFAILCATLALPASTASRARPTFKPVVWRSVGGGLLLFGVLWIVGGLFGVPTHSSVALKAQEERAVESNAVADFGSAERAMDQVIALQPLNWRGYFQRAQIGLSPGGSRTEAAQDFRRARFVEPRSGMVAYEEGVAWLPYDVTRTLSAWREALTRHIDSKDDLYRRMLEKASNNVALMEGMSELSQVDSDYRARFLLLLSGDAFVQEVRKELRVEPLLVRFTVEERAAILRLWVQASGADEVELYLSEFGNELDLAWVLYAMLRQKQFRYEEAVAMMREGLPVEEVPEVRIDLSRIERLRRSFFAASNDLAKGTALLGFYLEQGNYSEALLVVDQLIKQSNPPSYVYYWRAEILYELEDFFESWYAFQEYSEQLR